MSDARVGGPPARRAPVGPDVVSRFRTAAAGGGAPIPVHARFGVRASAADVGHIEVVQVMGPYCLDRHGRLSPGAFLVAADAALGAAVASELPGTQSVASLTIGMQWHDLRRPDTQAFRIRGRSTHVGKDSGFAVGEILTDSGRVVASLTTHCAVLPVTGPMRPSATFPIDRSLLSLDVSTDDEGLAPIARHAGGRLASVSEHEVRVTATSRPDLHNSRGDMQGGVLAMFAEQAITACLTRSVPAVTEADTMELNVTFVRPLRPERPHLQIVAQQQHASRRFVAAQAVGHDDSGQVVVLASGSRYRG